MRFRVLGPLQVRRSDGDQVSLSDPTQRALLTRLIIANGAAVSSAHLFAAAYQDGPRPSEDEFAAQLAALSGQLEGTGAEIYPAERGHLLRLDRRMLDAARFLDRVAAAKGFQDAPERIAVLEQALSLWRGPAYEEFATGLGADAARQLEEERAAAVESLAQARLEIGDLGPRSRRFRGLGRRTPTSGADVRTVDAGFGSQRSPRGGTGGICPPARPTS